MTIQMIKEVVTGVVEGKCSISEGAETLNMSLIDFERLLNNWEDAQQAWSKMLQIAIISEMRGGRTDEEIMADMCCGEMEIEYSKRRLERTLGAINDVREGNKTLTCGSCVARVYISEFARMMEQEVKTHE